MEDLENFSLIRAPLTGFSMAPANDKLGELKEMADAVAHDGFIRRVDEPLGQPVKNRLLDANPLKAPKDYYQVTSPNFEGFPKIRLNPISAMHIRQSPFLSDRAKQILCGEAVEEKRRERGKVWKAIIIGIGIMIFLFAILTLNQKTDQQVQVNKHFNPSSYSTEGGW